MATDPLPDDLPSRISLTDPFLKGLRPRDAGDYYDAEQPGLLARVLPSGRIAFQIRYRFQGKRRRLGVGTYPATKLAAARVRAREVLTEVDHGKDPAGARRAAKATPTDTVDALVADYLKRHARPHKDSADEDERMLNVDVLPAWKARSVRGLTRRDVRRLLEKKVDDQAPIAANRLLALIRKMLNFAVDHDWIDANPAARIPKPSKETSRERVLSDDEIRQLWRCLTRPPATADKPAPGRKSKRRQASADPLCPVSAAVSQALRVQLLTAQRPGEVVGMKWADVDLDRGWWTIPGEDTKNGEEHRVFLVPDVVTLLKARRPAKGEPEKALVFAGTGEAIADNAKKAPARLSTALGFHMTRHDLRRTATTLMARSGIPEAHIDRVLNHVDGGPRTRRVYNRYDYDAEKRVALETLARTLTAILRESRPAKGVVAFRRRR